MNTPTAAEILALPPDRAYALFAGTEADVAARFHALAKVWHPDRSRDLRAATVMAKLVELRDAALRRFVRVRVDTGLAGPYRFMRVARLHDCAFGAILLGRETVVYKVDGAFDRGIETAKAFAPRFADAAMKAAIEPFLPTLRFEEATAEGHVFAYRRRPDQILLRDLIAAEGPIDPRHVAWMITRLMNLAAWLDFAGWSHGDIGPDTLLVSPEVHSVALTGPMLFLTRLGDRPRCLPARSLEAVPGMLDKRAVADPRVDLALIRLTAREALGDASGSRLVRDPTVPPPLALWLTLPPKAPARDDFLGWEAAREAAFGPRRFVAWDFDPANLY
jgi:hypothetical protein